MKGITPDYLGGLVNNLLIMLASSALPLGVGVGLTFLLNGVRAKGLRIAMRVLGAVFWSLQPIALLLTLYYGQLFVNGKDRFWPIALAIMISHIGFFALFYNENASAVKNIVVNALGLLSSAFAWSFIAGYIGGMDLLRTAGTAVSRTFDPGYYLAALLIAAAVLLALNIPRMILKETMK